MLDQLNASLALIINQTQANYPTLTKLLLLLFGVYFLNLLLGKRLFIFGLFPRHIWGLPGIFFAPFLHADFNHLFFNAIPLVVLSNFILINGFDYYLQVSAEIILISGILIWCFGQRGIHIGASALITGYWAFLVSDIMQQGTLTAYILGMICLYYFAGIFFGIFPSRKGVSWEGHLFGLIAGIITNYWH